MKNITVKSIRKIPYLMTMEASGGNSVGLIEDAAILIEANRIRWVGKDKDCPASDEPGIVVDGAGLVAMPGLIDCHAHPVFGGDRVEDFYERARGTSYAQIMARGGGIQHTVKQTRAATKQQLVEATLESLHRMLGRGVTTIEAKSGYGLNLDDELKILEVIQELNQIHAIELAPTFLGAHSVPVEFAGRSGEYIDFLLAAVLPQISQRKLASAVDVFVENGAFDSGEARRLLTGASQLGFHVKVHADQLSASGGARLAAELGATSASHLEHASADDFKALATANVVAEILPISEVYLGLNKVADLRQMLDFGVKIAIATDYNPGSSMCDDLQLALRLSVTHRKLTVEEALLGVTHLAACALGKAHEIGQIKKGLQADICLFEGASPWTLAYDWTKNPIKHVIKSGSLVSAM